MSHCKCKAVCVGFLYTVVMRDLSGCGITNVSKKGMDPSSLDISEVNWNLRSGPSTQPSILQECRTDMLITLLWSQKQHRKKNS